MANLQIYCQILRVLHYLSHSAYVRSIHETEIKQFRNRNGQNRVKIISTLGHKSRIVETDYEGRNELRGSKRITRVETNYEDRNELRGSKRITRIETNYEGRNEL